MAGLENISRPNMGNDNLPFVHSAIYVAEQKNVTGALYPENPATYRDACKVNFADLTIAGLVKMATTELKGKLDGELVAPDHDGQIKKHVLGFNLAGTKDENLGFDRMTNNAKLIFFVQEKSGRIRIVGNNTYAALKATSADTTGDDGTTNGLAFTFESFGPGPALIMNGNVGDLEGLLEYSGSASASF